MAYGWIEARTSKAGVKSFRARYSKDLGRTFSRRSDAQAWLDDMGSRHDLEPKSVTLRTFFEQYRDSIYSNHKTIRASTAIGYEIQWKKRIEPMFGDRPISSLEKGEIDKWIRTTLPKRVGAASVRQTWIVLNKTLTYAVALKVRPDNPAQGSYTVEQVEERIDLSRALEFDEMDKLADMMPEHLSAMIYVMGYGGLRISECIALRVGGIVEDDQGMTLRVVQGYTKHNGFAPPKSRRGKRSVPVPERAAKHIRHHLKFHARSRRPEDLVFSENGTTPIEAANFRNRIWVPATRSVGLGNHTTRDLRVTAISNWYAAGCSPVDIQIWAGHSTAVLSQEVYAEQKRKLTKGKMAKLDELAGEGPPLPDAGPSAA